MEWVQKAHMDLWETLAKHSDNSAKGHLPPQASDYGEELCVVVCGGQEVRGKKLYHLWSIVLQVHIDELFIGGPEEQKRGNSKGNKRLVIAALEKVKDGVGSAYAQIIENASSEKFKPFFKSCRGYFHIASLVI